MVRSVFPTTSFIQTEKSRKIFKQSRKSFGERKLSCARLNGEMLLREKTFNPERSVALYLAHSRSLPYNKWVDKYINQNKPKTWIVEFEDELPALFFALHVYHPSMFFDVFDNWRMDWSEEFLMIASAGGSFPFSNVQDNSGWGIPLALQLISAVLPSKTVWFLGLTATTGNSNSKLKIGTSN